MSIRLGVIAVGALLALAGLVVAATSVAEAAPARTTVKLSCDRTVGSAEVRLELRTDLFGPQVGTASVSCGPDSTSGLRSEAVVVPANAGWVNVSAYLVTDAGGSDGCLGGGVLPFKSACRGATLVVR